MKTTFLQLRREAQAISYDATIRKQLIDEETSAFIQEEKDMQYKDKECDQVDAHIEELTTLAFSFGPPMKAELLQWMEEKNVLERKLTELR